MMHKNWFANFSRNTVLLLVILISLGPIVWVFIGSFKTYNEMFSSAFSLPSHISLKNYLEAFRLAPIGRFFINSVIVSSVNTFICVLIVSACAYVVSRYDFRMKKVIIALISVALLLPAQSLAIPIFSLLKSMHLVDTKTGLIFVYTAFGIPISFFIMRSYYLSIPKSLEEAAYIDGAGFLTTFFRIIAPLAKPGMATAAILQFLSSWNEFFFALVLTSGKTARTIPIALNYYMGTFANNYSALFAAVILTIIPTIVIFILSQEQVVDSLTAGAVKG
jgi:raffinose/stachyose/melibiose transport system permease protein